MASETRLALLAEQLLAARPELEALEALLLAAVLDSLDELSGLPRRGQPDTGRLARWLDIEHALVRRTAAALEAKGWIDTTPKSGRSPALLLGTDDPEKLRALIR